MNKLFNKKVYSNWCCRLFFKSMGGILCLLLAMFILLNIKSEVFAVDYLAVKSSFAEDNVNNKENLPNIILIVADDLGYGDLSCYGASKIESPNIDRLAASGMRFTNAYSASSLCSPSRYSILTGRYSWRTHLKKGVLTPFAQPLIKNGETTIASMLKKSDYYTAYVGKWHLGFNWPLKNDDKSINHQFVFDSWGLDSQEYINFDGLLNGGPTERGFDYFFGMPGSNNMIPYVFIENDKIVEPPTVENDIGHKTLKASNWDLRFIDDLLKKKAVDIIDKHFLFNKSNPLFLYLATSAVHTPCLPEYTSGSSKAGLRGDKVVEFDKIVGEIINSLKSHNALDNSLIIVTSDNGPLPGDPYLFTERMKNKEFGENYDYFQDYFNNYNSEYLGNNGQANGWLTYGHSTTGPALGFKSDAWEGGLRIPLIIHWPQNVKEGFSNHNTVCLVDLLATIADVTDIELSKNEGEDSYSFYENFKSNVNFQIRNSLTMVSGRSGALTTIKDGWKWIEPVSDSLISLNQVYPPPPNEYPEVTSVYEPHLYNLNNDPSETTNLISLMPEKGAELKSIINIVKEKTLSEGKYLYLPREIIIDKIRGGLLGQIIGNLNGLPHEMVYIDEPGNVKNYVPHLPEGAWSDDDTDFEWVYVLEMQRDRNLMLSEDQIYNLWKERINNRIWCSNLFARCLMDIGIKPPYTGNIVFNPWANFNVSGQFLCETFGLMAPAMPNTAAKIGLNYTTVAIDGEPAQATQLFTSMIATAFFENDIFKIIDAGLNSIDKKSIINDIINDIKKWHQIYPNDWRKTRQLLKEKYTIENGNIRDMNGIELNTGSIIGALLYGNGDFAETLKLAFNFGWDADCNAATVGTIVGVMDGYRKIMSSNDQNNQPWQIVDRYKNVTRDNMPMDETITSFADRVFDLFEIINEQNGGDKIVKDNNLNYRIVSETPLPVKELNDSIALKLLKNSFEPIILNDLLSENREDKARAVYFAVCLELDTYFARQYSKEWSESCYLFSGYWKIINNIFSVIHDFNELKILQQKFEKAGFKRMKKNFSNKEVWDDKILWKEPNEIY